MLLVPGISRRYPDILAVGSLGLPYLVMSGIHDVLLECLTVILFPSIYRYCWNVIMTISPIPDVRISV